MLIMNAPTIAESLLARYDNPTELNHVINQKAISEDGDGDADTITYVFVDGSSIIQSGKGFTLGEQK